MNIAVLMGSPNERGSTYLLADAFRRGAEERGHEVQLNDVAACPPPALWRVHRMRL